MDIKYLIDNLTIEEKALLLEGHDSWMTNSIHRLGIKSIYLTDGPFGVRKKQGSGDGALGLGIAHPATLFPSPSNLASSFDTNLAYLVFEAIAKEANYYDVQILLAPAMNIKRNPLCGRSFEYFSEDPILSGNMAASVVKGLQDNNVSACLKHFLLNSCENFRYMSDSVIDKRALNEIYLKNFKIALENSDPDSIMVSYNKYNGIHLSENDYLINDILRNEFKYDGLIMTDWGATKNRVNGIKASIDLDMPGGIIANRRAIIDYFKNNPTEIHILDSRVRNVLNLINKHNVEKSIEEDIFTNNYKLALNAALESAVLLKNEDNILPLNKNKKYLILGDFFKNPVITPTGSGRVNPKIFSNPYEYFSGRADFDYLDYNNISKELLENYDDIIIFAGLSELKEGVDRKNLLLSERDIKLIDELSSTKNVILVLFSGCVVELPFYDKLKSILYMGLPGEAIGEACYNLLYGLVSPSGRLSETWPRSLEVVPYYNEFSNSLVEKYKESIFVGYRYYLDKEADVLFPFGYGLSYTLFEYTDISVNHRNNKIIINMKITNKGLYDSYEVIEIYAGKNMDSKVFKAKRELKAFTKVFIKSNETKDVTLEFDESEMSYYNTNAAKFVLENGIYPIYVAKSAFDIIYEENISITGQEEYESPYNKKIMEIYTNHSIIEDEEFYSMVGYKPSINSSKYITIETPIMEYKNKFLSSLCLKIMLSVLNKETKKIKKMPPGKTRDELLKNQEFMNDVMIHNCIRSLIQSSGGYAQMKLAYGLVDIANGHIIKGLFKLLRREKKI
ncbi:MAG: beta-glucosidase [Anaeroplasmataceae bacterium]